MGRVSRWFQKLRHKVLTKFKSSTAKSDITSMHMIEVASSVPTASEVVLPASVAKNTRESCHASSRNDILKRRRSLHNVDDVDHRHKKIRAVPSDIHKRRRSLDDVDDIDHRHKKNRTVPKHSIPKVLKLKRKTGARKYKKRPVPLTPALVANNMEDYDALSDTDTEMPDLLLGHAQGTNRPAHSSYFSYADALQFKKLYKHRVKKPISRHNVTKVSKLKGKVGPRKRV
jgi:hypothetical protein